MSNKEPLVSVLLSIYKVEEYLEECLDSILAQSYKNLEIVCVDNGSPDGCEKILKKYALKDKRIKIITLKENRMLCGGRNAGLDNAHGEFICFIDPDDWIEKDHIKVMVDAILTKKDSQGKSYNMILNANAINYYVSPNGETKLVDINPPNTIEGEVTYKEVNNCIPFETNIPMWSRLYRKSFLDIYNIRFLEGFNTDNIPYTFKILAHMEKFYRIINQPNSCYHRRLLTPDGAITSTVLYKNLEIPACLDNLYDYLKKYKLEHKIRVPYYLLFSLCISKHQYPVEYYNAYKELLFKMKNDILYNTDVYHQCDKDLCQLLIGTTNFFQFSDLYFRPIQMTIKNISKYTLKLFGIIPILKKRTTSNSIKYKILGVPVWKIKIKNDIIRCYLFDFIPLLKYIKK